MVDCVFDALIKHYYQVDVHKKEQFDISLTYEEQNALCYTSGYVVKAVLKKLRRSVNPVKNKMIQYLQELITRDDNKRDSEDWTALVGRGGLTHVGDMTYGFFESMELEVKKFCSRHSYQLGKVKQELRKKIVENEDDIVLFWGSSIS